MGDGLIETQWIITMFIIVTLCVLFWWCHIAVDYTMQTHCKVVPCTVVRSHKKRPTWWTLIAI